jgi:hypothetical protein
MSLYLSLTVNFQLGARWKTHAINGMKPLKANSHPKVAVQLLMRGKVN